MLLTKIVWSSWSNYMNSRQLNFTHQHQPVKKTCQTVYLNYRFLIGLTSFFSFKELGVQVNNVIFRGSIGPFSGDNLGSHLIGGYLESFNSLRICRICMATKQNIQDKVNIVSIQVGNG